MICKNCSTEFESKFCPECGQRATIKRLDSEYIINDLPSAFFSLDKGFLFTLKELFTRPGHTIREFIEGKRIKLYKPVAFYIIMGTAFILSANLLNKNTIIGDIISGMESAIEEENQKGQGINSFLNSELFEFILQYEVYIFGLLIPIFSYMTYKLFKKENYNYIEHLVLNFYSSGFVMLIYAIFWLILFKDINNEFAIIPLVLGIGHKFWTFKQFFSTVRWNKVILKLVGVYILYFITIMFFVIVIVSALVIAV